MYRMTGVGCFYNKFISHLSFCGVLYVFRVTSHRQTCPCYSSSYPGVALGLHLGGEVQQK